MSVLRKPRSDSKLDHLTDKQSIQLSDWLIGGLSYEKAIALLDKEYGVKASLRSLSSFWESYCIPVRLAQRQKAALAAEKIGELAARKPGQWDSALIDSLKQMTFQLMEKPNGASAEEVSFLMQSVLKVRDQDLKQADMKLKREKFEFDAAKACLKQLPALRNIAANKSLDQNQRLLEVRKKLFGEVPLE